MEQDEKVAPLESKKTIEGDQQSTETKDPETVTDRRPETEISTSQCKKEYVGKEVVTEAVHAIRPEVKAESRRSAVDEGANAETETAGRPEVVETTTNSSSSSAASVDKTLSAEISEKAMTSAESKRNSAPINPETVEEVQPNMMPPAAEPETSKTIRPTSGLGSSSNKEIVRSQQAAKTRRSNSVDSDKEITEILRNAPPPSVLSEEEEEEDVEGEEEEGMEDETGTVVIMKKTFTESVKPGQEFKPIADEFCPPPPTIPSSAALPCRLEHPVPSSSSSTAATTTTDGRPSNDSAAGRVAAGASASKTESEAEEDGSSASILSKARNEARDLTSELRRLQYFLENLSSFTELEMASFNPDDDDDSSSAMTQIESTQPSTSTPTAAAGGGRGGGGGKGGGGGGGKDENAVSSTVDNV